jgi:hypothetical protein
MRDRAVVARHERDVGVVHTYAVDEQRTSGQHAGAVEHPYRRRATRHHEDVSPAMIVGPDSGCVAHVARLRLALGNVHRDRQGLGAGIGGRRPEQGVRHRVRRVRRYADAHERGLVEAQRVDLPPQAG